MTTNDTQRCGQWVVLLFPSVRLLTFDQGNGRGFTLRSTQS